MELGIMGAVAWLFAMVSPLASLALIWGLTAAILAALIPLVAVDPALIGVAIALIAIATPSLIGVYRRSGPPAIPGEMEQRLRRLEAHCTGDELVIERSNHE